MYQQLPQVPLRQRRYPDLRELAADQQAPNQLGVATVMLLLARIFGPNRSRVPHLQLMTALFQQPLEPQHVSARFHPHARSASQVPIKLPDLLAFVRKPPVRHDLARFCFHGVHLLTTRMKITAYNQHRLAPLARAPWSHKKSTGRLGPSSLSNQAIARLSSKPPAIS